MVCVEITVSVSLWLSECNDRSRNRRMVCGFQQFVILGWVRLFFFATRTRPALESNQTNRTKFSLEVKPAIPSVLSPAVKCLKSEAAGFKTS